MSIKDIIVNGSSAVKMLLADGTVVWQKSELPSGYTKALYIQSSGHQYIETGYSFTNNTGSYIDITPSYLSPTQSFGSVWYPSYNADGYSFHFFTTYLTGALLTSYNGGTPSVSGFAVANKRTQQTTNYPIGYSYYWVDGSEKATYTFTNTKGEFTSSPYTIALFACKYFGTTLREYTICKLHRCSLYENNVIQHDYVPCVRDSDSVAGLYDVIGDVFYENNGTGTFGYELENGTYVSPT